MWLSVLLLIYLVHELFWKRRRLPPGPLPWLIAGNVPQLLLSRDRVEELFLQWKRRYGPIFTFWIGPIPLVMVCELGAIKNLFVKNADLFSNRWRNFVTDTFMGGANGVVQIDGDKWMEQRRFSLRVLRDFGFGKSLMEQRIQGEVADLVAYFSKGDRVVDPSQALAVCVGNIINGVLFGKRFDHDSHEFHDLHAMLDRHSRLVIRPEMGIYIAAPWTTKIPWLNEAWKKLLANRKQLWTYLIDQVEEHKSNFDVSLEPSDFTFAYMQEMENRRSTGADPGHFSEWQLTMLLLDLFFAGMETTITTMKWGFLFMLLEPDVQRRVQSELDQCGPVVTLADRMRLPYTQATINEVQRLANILPINLLRTVSEDCTMEGFEWTANCLVIPQISVVMTDPDNFVQPHHFDPQRFLDEDGQLKRCEHLLPFSLGKRQCLGESLARAELFLILANVLRHFNLAIPQGQGPPSRRRLLGLTVSPPPFDCWVEKRLSD